MPEVEELGAFARMMVAATGPRRIGASSCPPNVRAAIGGRPAQASSINVGNSAGNRGALIKKADSTDPVITVRDNKRTSACNVTANVHDGCERLAFLNSL
jgi:hypothetical protein